MMKPVYSPKEMAQKRAFESLSGRHCQRRYASSHREAPLISQDPLADNTDVYAFKSPVNAENIVLIANYIPFEHPAGGPNWYSFGENIRYEIHVDNNTTRPRPATTSSTALRSSRPTKTRRRFF